MTNAMFMFDDVNLSLDPPGAYAYAGYVDGLFNNFSALERMFPTAHLLSITVFGNHAECADVEAGDLTNAQVFSWFLGELAAFTYRPCVYTSASNAFAMQATMQANGFARSSYRLWTAHYTGVPHFCAPNTCGFGMDQADATQFTPRALGRSLDESIVAPDFFGTPPDFAFNPVQGLKVTRTGWTSVDLAWNGQRDAIGYTVKVINTLGHVKQDFTVSVPSVRVRNLQPFHRYEFQVRAHPAGSTGADASVKATTL